FIIGLGRFGVAQGDVNGAARDAARAASIARSAGAAQSDGEAAGRAALAEGQVPCQSSTVTVKPGAFTAGSEVTADVTCVVELRDVSQFWTPGSVPIPSRFIAVVDRFRGVR